MEHEQEASSACTHDRVAHHAARLQLQKAILVPELHLLQPCMPSTWLSGREGAVEVLRTVRTRDATGMQLINQWAPGKGAEALTFCPLGHHDSSSDEARWPCSPSFTAARLIDVPCRHLQTVYCLLILISACWK